MISLRILPCDDNSNLHLIGSISRSFIHNSVLCNKEVRLWTVESCKSLAILCLSPSRVCKITLLNNSLSVFDITSDNSTDASLSDLQTFITLFISSNLQSTSDICFRKTLICGSTSFCSSFNSLILLLLYELTSLGENASNPVSLDSSSICIIFKFSL